MLFDWIAAGDVLAMDGADVLIMLQPALAAAVIENYATGDERAPEHDRNGAFLWWLRRRPDARTLRTLVELSVLDPDPPMAKGVRRHIRANPNADDVVRRLIEDIDGDAERSLPESR